MANVPVDLLDRIRALEDKVRQIEGRTQQRPAQNQVLGNVTVGTNGALQVLDNSGDIIFWVGGIAPAHPDGSPQRGLLVYREDGSAAISLFSGDSSPQQLSIYDRHGEMVVADDVTNWGLAGPWIPIPMSAGVPFTWATWASTHVGLWRAQNPLLDAEYSVFAPSGSTAQARLMINIGGTLTQLGSTISASGGETFASYAVDPSTHGLTHNAWGSLVLQTQRTVGTGTCTAWVQGMYGRQS